MPDYTSRLLSAVTSMAANVLRLSGSANFPGDRARAKTYMAQKNPMRPDIREIAAALLERANATSWSQDLHVMLVGSIACRTLGVKPSADQALALKSALGHKGVAGNASQFSQALAEEGVISRESKAKTIAGEFIIG